MSTPHSSLLPPKDENALKTIGEVSDLLDIPQHVLRFWEAKFKQIKPIKRRSGHRYYRPEDITIIGQVRHLLHEQGYTIKGAQKYFKDAKKNPTLQTEQPDLFPHLKTAEETTLQTESAAKIEAPSGQNDEYLRSVLNTLIELRALLQRT